MGDVEFFEFLLGGARGQEVFEAGADGSGIVEFDMKVLRIVRGEADFVNGSDGVLFDEGGVGIVLQIGPVGGV